MVKIMIENEELDKLNKDRLDFGFDSIYFRYSELVEELGWYKELEAARTNQNFNRKNWCNTKRMHFYNCLEQLLNAHPEGEVNDINK